MGRREDQFERRIERFYRLPLEGVSSANLRREFEIAKKRFPVIYGDEQFAKPGTEVDLEALMYAFEMIKTRNPNLVEPSMFLGAWEIEREAVSMVAEMFNHPVCKDTLHAPGNLPILGWFTGGGTASLHQAVLGMRNRYFRDLEARMDPAFDPKTQRGTFRNKGIPGMIAKKYIDAENPPVILAPVDMHFSGDKIAEATGHGSESIVRYGLNEDFTTDYNDLEKTLMRLKDKGTDVMFVVANAGSVDTGRVEDVKKLYETLQKAGCEAPIIVDAAQQYMMTALLKGKYPEWDFSVPGVKAIIADPHKTDMSTYPGSLVIFRDTSYAQDLKNRAGYLHNDDSLDYDMKDLAKLMFQFETSRSPIGAICTWAHLVRHGRQKLDEKYQKMYDLSQKLADYIEGSDHYQLIARPQTGIVPFHVKGLDDRKANGIYEEFEHCTEEPRFYITFADNMRVKSREDFERYSALQQEKDGKVNGFGGLYIQVMQHANEKLMCQLVERLERFGNAMTKKPFIQNIFGRAA